MPKKSPAKSGASSSKLTNKSSTKAKAGPPCGTPTAGPEKAAKAKPKAAKPGASSAVGILPPSQRPPAADFALNRDGAKPASLADYRGRKLVLFFYPKADTPGCTKEAIDFNRLRKAFDATGTDVIGISADSTRKQESFRAKYDLTVPMIADEARGVIEAYGAWGEKSMYGRTFEGVLRTTVLIDAKGRIAQVWRNVKVDGHADAVLAAAKALESSAE